MIKRPTDASSEALEQEASALTGKVMKTVLEVIKLRRVISLPRTLEGAFDALVEVHLRGNLDGVSQSRLDKTKEHVKSLQDWMASVPKKEDPMKDIVVKYGTQLFYEVSANSGEEGNGPLRILGYCQDESFATKFAKGRGACGGNAKVMSISREVIVFEDGSRHLIGKQLIFEDDVAAQTAKLIQSAKSKLTPEELSALLGGK